jgi:hypothetical protein
MDWKGLLERLSVVVFRTGTKAGKKKHATLERCVCAITIEDALCKRVQKNLGDPEFGRPDLSARSMVHAACRNADSLQFFKKEDCSRCPYSLG